MHTQLSSGLMASLITKVRVLYHRVIKLNRGSMPRKRMGKKVMQFFPDSSVQRHSVTSHGTARSLAYDHSGGGLRGNSTGIAASPISLLSMVALEESVGGA